VTKTIHFALTFPVSLVLHSWLALLGQLYHHYW